METDSLSCWQLFIVLLFDLFCNLFKNFEIYDLMQTYLDGKVPTNT